LLREPIASGRIRGDGGEAHNGKRAADRHARAAFAYADSSVTRGVLYPREGRKGAREGGGGGGGGGGSRRQRLLCERAQQREPIPASMSINANRRQIATVGWPFRRK